MSSLKNRINVDEKLAEVLREHYRCTVSTSTLAALCFSNPQLQSHCCNKLEKLEGGHACTYCQQDPLKVCKYSCDVGNACLAAFAYRLGIGGDKVHAAVKKNLGLTYADLLAEIHKALGGNVSTEAEMVEAAEEVEARAAHKPPQTPGTPAKAPALSLESGTPTDLITAKAAASLWGCTAPNIYAKIKSGRLHSYTQGSSASKLVSRAEVIKIKHDTINRKG